MSIPIQNAADRPLSTNTGTLPDLSGALQDYFQPMTFVRVAKSTVGFRAVETKTNVDFRGVWQPIKQPMTMKPEGQRKWNRYQCFAETTLKLEPDEIVTYLGVPYRVEGVDDFSLEGYLRYELVEDYTP